MKTLTFEPGAGSHIRSACCHASNLARMHHARVRFQFNDLTLVASPKQSVDSLLWQWETRRSQIELAPAAVAARQKSEAAHASANISRQKTVDALMESLPPVLATTDQDIHMQWLKEFTPLVDWAGIIFSADQFVELFEAAGYKKNAHVGQPPEFFNTRQNMAQYIIGQALNCVIKMGCPHPMTTVFCERYFLIPN